MKLGTSTEPLKCSAPLEKAAFQLGNSAVLIKILRQQLYTDPIQAITQEVMSNARDAHRELGNADVPIEVRLPTRIKPEFSVRDFGVGISPDRMTDVFIKYGESTKRADNIQTGGFGIGAKTPLAYSDQFTIETFYPDEDGQVWRRRYLAAIDSNEIGDLHFIGEAEPTDEPRGTKISLTVKPGDEHRFINGVRRAASFWDPRPRILGITEKEIAWEEITPSLKGDGWMVLSKDPMRPTQRRAVALVDGIPYALSYSSIVNVADDDDGQGLKLAFDLDFAITLEVGEVSVTASREGLEYTPEATKTIRERIVSMMSELTRGAVSKVKNQTDLWKAYEAWWALPDVVREYVKAQNGGKPLKWNNIPLHREFQLPAGAHVFEYSKTWRDTGMGTSRNMKKTFHPGRLMDTGTVFIHDDKTKTPPRARAMSLFKDGTATLVNILVLPNGTEDLNNPTVPLQASEDQFGLLTYAKGLEKFSSVPKYYPPRRSGGAIPALKTYQVNGWYEVDLDFEDEDDVVFVQLYHNQPYAAEGLRRLMCGSDIASAQHILGERIIGVQTPFIKKVPDTWKWLKTHLNETLEEQLQDAEVQEAFAAPLCENFFEGHLTRLNRMVTSGKVRLPVGGILEQWRNVEGDHERYEKIRNRVTSLALMIGQGDKLPAREKHSTPFLEVAEKKVPLLFAHEDSYSSVPTPAKEIQWYIDQKDVPAANPKEDKDVKAEIDRKAWEMKEHENHSWREIERALGMPDHNGNAARRAAKRHKKTMGLASAAD